MKVYLARTGRSVAMVCGSVDPDAYVSGPYSSLDDAEAALRALTARSQFRDNVMSGVILLALFTAVMFLVTPTIP